MDTTPASAKVNEHSSQVDLHGVESLKEEEELSRAEKRTKNEEHTSAGRKRRKVESENLGQPASRSDSSVFSSSPRTQSCVPEFDGQAKVNFPPFGQDLSFEVDEAVIFASRRPSFQRTNRRSTSCELIKPHVKAPITNSFVPGQNIVIVRLRTSESQTNSTDHINLVPLEGDEEIAQEEAVCKFCFEVFKEENTFKTECRCKKALIHEECAINWSRVKGNDNCDVCGQKVQNLPVTLLRGLNSTQRLDRQEGNKRNWLSKLKRTWRRSS